MVSAAQEGGRNTIKLRSRSNPSKIIMLRNVSTEVYNKLKLKKGIVLLNHRNQVMVDGVLENCQTEFLF